MKVNNFMFLLIIIIFVNYSSQNYLKLTTHKTQNFRIQYDSWQDLIGKKVECPNRGVLKNFIIKTSGNQFWYEYQCYSSTNNGVDEGEPIIKDSVYTHHYRYSASFNNDIYQYNKLPISCEVDYGLNAFQMSKETTKVLRLDFNCKGLKPHTTTKIEIRSPTKCYCNNSLKSLADIRVGPTNGETNTNIAYVLRGFKFDMYSSYCGKTARFLYGYSIIRDMRVSARNYRDTFQRLKNGNNQKI